MRSRWLVNVLRRALSDEGGFSLPELIVATALMIVVLSGVLAILDSTVTRAPKDQERAHSIREAQVGLDRMVRDLRGSYALVQTGTHVMEADVVARGQRKRVRYDCSTGGQCRRLEGAAGGPVAASSTVAIDRVLNGTAEPVFTYAPNATTPTHVRAYVQVPAKGGRTTGHAHKVVFDDGFYLRNRNL